MCGHGQPVCGSVTVCPVAWTDFGLAPPVGNKNSDYPLYSSEHLLETARGSFSLSVDGLPGKEGLIELLYVRDLEVGRLELTSAWAGPGLCRHTPLRPMLPVLVRTSQTCTE